MGVFEHKPFNLQRKSSHPLVTKASSVLVLFSLARTKEKRVTVTKAQQKKKASSQCGKFHVSTCMKSWNKQWPLDGDRDEDQHRCQTTSADVAWICWLVCHASGASVPLPHLTTRMVSNIKALNRPLWPSGWFHSSMHVSSCSPCRMLAAPQLLTNVWAHWTREMMESSTSWSSGSWLGHLARKHAGVSANCVSPDTLLRVFVTDLWVCHTACKKIGKSAKWKTP